MIFQVDNKNVFASDSGQGIDKKKTTIVLLHGSGLSHIVWSLTEQYLSNQNYNILAIDLPGHGNSEGKSLRSIEEISDWLDKAFDVLNISNITIIGHSQGCLEALEYCSKYSKRVKRVVFVGGSYVGVHLQVSWEYVTTLVYIYIGEVTLCYVSLLYG